MSLNEKTLGKSYLSTIKMVCELYLLLVVHAQFWKFFQCQLLSAMDLLVIQSKSSKIRK